MRRFSQLEFGEGREPSKEPAASGEPVRDADYFDSQATRYWLAGDFESALRNYSRALEQNSAFYPGWLGQVMMLIELGEYHEAATWVDKALEMFPEHPELLSAKAVACARDGKTDKAMAYSDNAVTKEKLTSLVWLARAEVLPGGKGRIAENCISKAVSMAGDDAPILRLQAGRLLNRRGDYCSALPYLKEAIDHLAKSALAWYELGICQVKLGRPEGVVSLEQALKLQPNWEQASAALRKSRKRGLFGGIFGS